MANTGQQSALIGQLKLELVVKSGARWFYWIAGFSALNSSSVWLNLGFSFFILQGHKAAKALATAQTPSEALYPVAT
ncbi:MAG: hypothetical protein Q7U89_03345 [Coriobacteriia bacterium]|nr:hypothetical protein [Coriobacteriia bacterium]